MECDVAIDFESFNTKVIRDTWARAWSMFCHVARTRVLVTWMLFSNHNVQHRLPNQVSLLRSSSCGNKGNNLIQWKVVTN